MIPYRDVVKAILTTAQANRRLVPWQITAYAVAEAFYIAGVLNEMEHAVLKDEIKSKLIRNSCPHYDLDKRLFP